MPDTVLVTDRGVAAVRVLAALQRRGVKAISLHTSLDATALHARCADESVLLGGGLESYDDARQLVEAALQSGAQAVHPGNAPTPGLEAAVRAAGLGWLGGLLQVPAVLRAGDGLVEAVLSEEHLPQGGVPARAAEVVTGLDLTGASVLGSAEGVARGGFAVSIDVRADELAPVTAWDHPETDDVWLDPAVTVGSAPIEPLLAVLTVWGPDRESAYRRAAQVWDQLVIEGPAVRRPAALRGVRP